MENLKKKIQIALNIFKSGNLSKAEKICKKLISDNQNVAFLYNLLGLIYTEQKKLDLAIKIYERGILADPNFAIIYNNLGLLYGTERTNSSVTKAESLYKKSIELNKNNAEPYNNLANLYISLGHYKKAEDLYKKAIFINPKFSQSHFNLGNLYITLGKIEDARKSFKTSIKLNPNLVAAHRSLSRITMYKENNEHFNQLKELYKNINPSNEHAKIELGFALGKSYEDMKKYDKSFYYYNVANATCKNKIYFSIKDEKKKFDNIKKTFSKKLFKKFANVGFKEANPIFIVGMPRSGTTLTEQILSNHPKVFGGDEVDTIPYLIKKNFNDLDFRLFFENIIDFDKNNFKQIGREYILKMKDYSNNAERTTDKLSLNFTSIGIIKLILPKAKIVHCFRDPKDNIFSIFKCYFLDKRVTYSYNLKDLVDYYNIYHDLMNFWDSTLNDFIFNIKYENLISSTEDEVKKLLKFCDLEWNDECLNFYKNKRPIKTASDVQVRSKIYNTSVASWKNYEKYLSEFLAELNIT